MTRRRVIASNVTAPTNFVAECVMTATTPCTRFWSPRTTSTALYAPIPPVTPSAINATALLGYSIGQLPDYPIIQLLDYSIVPVFVSPGSIFSTCFVMTSRWATVVFLCSPTSTRGTDPARSWRARAPAVTTNSKELGSFVRSIITSNLPLGERSDYPRRLTAHAVQACAFGNDDSPESIDGRRELVVHDHVVVFDERRHLVARHAQAALDVGLAVLAASAEPLLEHVKRRRHDEDGGGFDAALPHLSRALHVDDENDVLPRVEQRPGVGRARPVEVAEDVRPLEELTGRDHRLEVRAAHEVIVHPVGFALARRTRRIGA